MHLFFYIIDIFSADFEGHLVKSRRLEQDFLRTSISILQLHKCEIKVGALSFELTPWKSSDSFETHDSGQIGLENSLQSCSFLVNILFTSFVNFEATRGHCTLCTMQFRERAQRLSPRLDFDCSFLKLRIKNIANPSLLT